ncbi:MAG: hypothetical protein IPO63_17190 [Bacteroidetes bacterium]|nr:hypothetical protein [Bacteroidota bacterium]
MSTKNLLITFDYELFLGKRSGRPIDCILQPTQLLLDKLKLYGAKAVFFVDSTYLTRLKEQGKTNPECLDDLKEIGNQLIEMVKAGHYVEPHIHPHWLDAVYDTTTREFDLSDITRYRFHQLTDTDKKEVFTSSVQILNHIILPHFPNYKVNAFRAGGWSIQPFSDFKQQFIEHGIRYDLTVVNRLYQFSNAQLFDYSDAPKNHVYYFDNRVEEENPNGKFIQIGSSVIPITKNLDLADRIYKKLLNIFKLDKDYGKGEGQASYPIEGHQPRSKNGINIFSRTHEVASFENLSLIKLFVYKKHLNQTNFLHLVSHPKMLGRHNLFIFDQFLKSVYKKDKIETDYIKIAENYLKLKAVQK